MQIITSLSAVNAAHLAIPSDITTDDCRDITANLLSACCDDDEHYYIESFLRDDPDMLRKNIIFGLERPKQIQCAVQDWNQTIQQEFIDKLKTAFPSGFMVPSTVPLDNGQSNQLYEAACQINNTWQRHAHYAVYLENEVGYPYLRTLLTSQETQDITANPERFLLVTLYLP